MFKDPIEIGSKVPTDHPARSERIKQMVVTGRRIRWILNLGVCLLKVNTSIPDN